MWITGENHKIIRNVTLYRHYFFTDNQFGLRDRRECILQLLEVLNDWMLSLDKGFSVDAICLDFQKAFDSVPYNRVLIKLRSYRMTGNILKRS